jgi:hypothetical protein
MPASTAASMTAWWKGSGSTSLRTSMKRSISSNSGLTSAQVQPSLPA